MGLTGQKGILCDIPSSRCHWDAWRGIGKDRGARWVFCSFVFCFELIGRVCCRDEAHTRWHTSSSEVSPHKNSMACPTVPPTVPKYSNTWAYGAVSHSNYHKVFPMVQYLGYNEQPAADTGMELDSSSMCWFLSWHQNFTFSTSSSTIVTLVINICNNYAKRCGWPCYQKKSIDECNLYQNSNDTEIKQSSNSYGSREAQQELNWTWWHTSIFLELVR